MPRGAELSALHVPMRAADGAQSGAALIQSAHVAPSRLLTCAGTSDATPSSCVLAGFTNGAVTTHSIEAIVEDVLAGTTALRKLDM